MSDLAAETGRRPSLIRRLLEEQGLQFEPHAVLARRYEEGASLDALSKEQGIARRALRELLVHRGVTIRRSGYNSGVPAESTGRP